MWEEERLPSVDEITLNGTLGDNEDNHFGYYGIFPFELN